MKIRDSSVFAAGMEELKMRVREIELSGNLEFDARSLLLINYYLVKMDILDLQLASRIEVLVCSRLITLTPEEVVILFVSHARLAWKTQYKLKEASSTKQKHTSRKIQTRVLTKDFWDDVLPMVSQRLHEFTLEQIVQILQAAAKPLADKRSVMRLLLGFFVEATKLLGEKRLKDPDFRKNFEQSRLTRSMSTPQTTNN